MPRLPQPGNDKGTWGGILNDYLLEAHDNNGDIKANAVGSLQLASNAVTTAALAPNSVTTNSIANGSVTTATLSADIQSKLNTVAVGVADGSISTTQLADNAVTAAKLATAVQTSITSANSAVQSINNKTGKNITLAAADLGLGNVDNTADADKIISTATQTALNLKASTSTLATVATTGSYTNLSDQPTIPTTASQIGAVSTAGLDTAVATTIATSNSSTATTLSGLYATSASVTSKYTKPGSGIPLSDLDTNIQAELTASPNYMRAAKSSNTTITSSTSISNDPDLTVSVAANGKYAFELLLAYEADTGVGIRLEFVAPSGCTIFGIGFGIASTNVANSIPGAAMTIQYASATNTAFGVAGGVGSGTGVGYRISGTLTTGSNAGTFGLAWAQGTSSSVSTILYTGSELSVTKVG